MPFLVTMMLADAAQAVDNKLYVIGGGWSILRGHGPTALALMVKVPWDQTNVDHVMKLELVDSDGHAVKVSTPVGEQPVLVENVFQVGRPPGIAPGTPIDLAFALNLGPLPLANGRYEWRLTIGDESDENWRLPFQMEVEAEPEGPNLGES